MPTRPSTHPSADVAHFPQSATELSSSPRQEILATPRDSRLRRKSSRVKRTSDESFAHLGALDSSSSRIATRPSPASLVTDTYSKPSRADHASFSSKPHDMRLRDSHFGIPSSTPVRQEHARARNEDEDEFTPDRTREQAALPVRPSLDQVIQRSVDRTRAWAETARDDTSSDEEYVPKQMTPKNALPSATQLAALLPSPLPHRQPDLATPASARHGIMDQFLSAHGAKLEPEAAVPQVPSAMPSTSAAVPQSPPPSRPSLGVLDSPDVKRLLESELSELESRTSPQRAKQGREHDIIVGDAFKSPHHRNRETMFGSIGSPALSSGKRAREVFQSGSDLMSSVKRSRWTGEDIDSPTPSVASYATQTYSDSSPEKLYPMSQPIMTAHPASAPDLFYHQGRPSSSPESSHGSHSDYHPHSSPAMRSYSANAAAGPSRKRAVPLKRADTAPEGPVSNAKPSYSYAALIGQAIMSVEDKRISLADIYSFIMTRYPFYKKEDAGWQNSIRHNLSLNECFVKTARAQNNPGKGCLWAIAAGCEYQFANGGFIKKGGAQKKTSRASGGGRASSAGKFESNGLLKPPTTGRRGRATSPTPSTGRASPAPSAFSRSDEGRHSPAVSSLRDDDYTPPTTATSRMDSFEDSKSTLSAPAMSRRVSSVSQVSDASSMAEIGFTERPVPVVAPSVPIAAPRSAGRHHHVEAHPMQPVYAAAPLVPAQPSAAASTVARPSRAEHVYAATSPVYTHQRRESNARRTAATSPTIASPPTNVYMQLAGPYQPMTTVNPSSQSHRALALLASPEAVGILPAFDRPATMGGEPPFLPAPRIFPKSGRRNRSASDDEEEDERRLPPASSVTSPTSAVHIQSPVSSVRGGPRRASSPKQEVEAVKTSKRIAGDPEKKRSRSHLPSVAALAAESGGTFGTPPRHVRSPSSRTVQVGANAGYATLGTPRRGPWTSPGQFASPGAHGSHGHQDGWAPWSDPYGGGLEAELEHFGRHRRGDSTSFASGGSIGMGPRLYWPSPGGPPHAHHQPLGW